MNLESSRRLKSEEDTRKTWNIEEACGRLEGCERF